MKRLTLLTTGLCMSCLTLAINAHAQDTDGDGEVPGYPDGTVITTESVSPPSGYTGGNCWEIVIDGDPTGLTACVITPNILVIIGTSGNDVIDVEKIKTALCNGGYGTDCSGGVVVDAGDGNDEIRGSSGNDVLRGGNGNDKISGGGGDDVICGEGGEDDLRGGDGNDTITGGPGDDILRGGAGDDYLRGNGGDDKLHGGSGNDDLAGNAGSDVMFGDEGTDFWDNTDRSGTNLSDLADEADINSPDVFHGGWGPNDNGGDHSATPPSSPDSEDGVP